MPTYLKVPFNQKDIAKRLGARWDSNQKSWYVPDNLEVKPFSAWLPLNDFADISNSEMTLTIGDTSSQPLSKFLRQISVAINTQFSSQVWVQAELSEIRTTVGGHINLGLVEYDTTGVQTAKTSGIIWRSQADALLEKFKSVTGGALQTGMKLLLLLRPEFHPAYGFSVVITDIDPAYTLGEMALQLNAIRKELVARGIMDKNRSLVSPVEFCRVAVISPYAAAGLGDFRQTADPLELSGLCEFIYHYARFQGPEAANALTSILLDIQAEHALMAYDAICIIRGGGSATDLLWLNVIELAVGVCQCGIPVFTGIGHERDNTILDEIAHFRFDTPSKVIAYIAGIIFNNAQNAERDMNSIRHEAINQLDRADKYALRHFVEINNTCSKEMQLAMLSIVDGYASIKQSVSMHITEADFAMQSWLKATYTHQARQLTLVEQNLVRIFDLIIERIHHELDLASVNLKELGAQLLGLGPEPTLARGYALVRSPAGTVLCSAESTAKCITVNIQFHDGNVCADTREQSYEQNTKHFIQ